MTTRHWLLTALAAGHLALVAGSAAHVHLLPPSSLPARGVRWYGAMTGADSGYGFFAPAVGSPSRATFTMTDASGRTWTDVLDGGANGEARLRVGSILSSAAFPELRDDLVASWAGKMFGRHPDAREVVVRIEVHDMPSMEEYRRGDRPHWRPAYQATFLRNPDIARAEER